MFSFLQSRYVQAATLLLVAQAIAYFGFAQTERTPFVRPLKEFPAQLDAYRSTGDVPVDEISLGALAPDDYLSRSYQTSATALPVNLFIAYFRSQRHGFAPHSPKNCLPGSGWKQISATIVPLTLPGGGSIEVNHYVVEREGSQVLVLYWFQQGEDSFYDEIAAQLHVLPRLLFHQRTDTALARVIVPAGPVAVQEATAFARLLYPALRQQIP